MQFIEKMSIIARIGMICVHLSHRYCFMTCIMINMILNTCFGSIIRYIGKFYSEHFFLIVILNYLGRTV
jgi:hypothetical protein